MAHEEMIATMVYQLLKGCSAQQIKAANAADYYVDHTAGVYPQGASGMPYTTAYIQSKGDPITDLSEDMAAEQKARTTYENLMRLAKDPEVYGPLVFLRQRAIVHFQRFGEASRNSSARIWTAATSIVTIQLLTADQKRNRRDFPAATSNRNKPESFSRGNARNLNVICEPGQEGENVIFRTILGQVRTIFIPVKTW